MNAIRPEQVINGSWGEAWLDGDYLAEITGLEAKIVTSRFIKLLSDNLKAGKQTSVTIITKLDDPDSVGVERIAIKNATFNDLTLANWEAKTKGEEEASFNYDDWEPLDTI